MLSPCSCLARIYAACLPRPSSSSSHPLLLSDRPISLPTTDPTSPLLLISLFLRPPSFPTFPNVLPLPSPTTSSSSSFLALAHLLLPHSPPFLLHFLFEDKGRGQEKRGREIDFSPFLHTSILLPCIPSPSTKTTIGFVSSFRRVRRRRRRMGGWEAVVSESSPPPPFPFSFRSPSLFLSARDNSWI